MKVFLSIRDKDLQFDEIKERGSIGIPCIVEEDGTVTLDWEKYM